MQALQLSGNLFLVGPMGSGKTTIGRQLSIALGKSFYDSDKEIESQTGASVSLIFDLEKEEGFRKREQKMIVKLTELPNIVLATGGGVVINETNRQLLTKNGVVIYLYCPVDQQLKRTEKDKTRPLLQTPNPEEKLIQLFKERDPLYRSVADIVVETGQGKVRLLVEKILKKYNEYCGNG